MGLSKDRLNKKRYALDNRFGDSYTALKFNRKEKVIGIKYDNINNE